MRLTEVDIKEVRPRGKYASLLDEFMASEMKAAGIDEIDSVERITYEGLKHAARKYESLDVIKRGDDIFIVRLS